MKLYEIRNLCNGPYGECSMGKLMIKLLKVAEAARIIRADYVADDYGSLYGTETLVAALDELESD